MAAITEDYVSFETAKLLKEKGFDEYCRASYDLGNGELSQFVCHCYGDNRIQAPTLQMAMKWLREVHDLHIIVSPYKVGKEEKAFHWCCEVYKSFNLLGCRIYANETPKSYEEGVEIAIKYCLEHLIHIAKKSK